MIGGAPPVAFDLFLRKWREGKPVPYIAEALPMPLPVLLTVNEGAGNVTGDWAGRTPNPRHVPGDRLAADPGRQDFVAVHVSPPIRSANGAWFVMNPGSA